MFFLHLINRVTSVSRIERDKRKEGVHTFLRRDFGDASRRIGRWREGVIAGIRERGRDFREAAVAKNRRALRVCARGLHLNIVLADRNVKSPWSGEAWGSLREFRALAKILHLVVGIAKNNSLTTDICQITPEKSRKKFYSREPFLKSVITYRNSAFDKSK